MERTLGNGYKRVEHLISERLSNKLAEVAARKAEEAQTADAEAQGAQRAGKEYYRGPHTVSPDLQQKLAENRERLLAKAQEQVLADEHAVGSAVRQHQATLSRNLRKALVTNEYGAVVEDNRPAEIERFLLSVGLAATSLSEKQACRLVECELNILESEYRAQEFDPTSFPHDGHEFEHWLAASLEKFGWSASVTIASGDQGVDILAKKGDLSVAIQAKRYAGKVGNKAVQEVYSGAKHLGLSDAAVVTTVGFTQSARDLADSTGVTLLHVEDLPRLDALVTSKL